MGSKRHCYLLVLKHFRVLAEETTSCHVYEEAIESLEEQRETLRKEGSQMEEERRNLHKSVQAGVKEVKELGDAIESMEKVLANPEKVKLCIYFGVNLSLNHFKGFC